MNSPAFLASLLCTALAVACLVLLTVRRLRTAGSDRLREGARVPPVMRLLMPVALLLEPLVACLLPRSLEAARARQLDALALAPGLNASRWEALCLAQGVATGGLAAAVLPWGLPAGLAGAAVGHLLGGAWLKQQLQVQERRIARELPAWLDLMTVCVEAGATLGSGLRLIVAQAPPGPLRDFFERVLREVRGGRPRAQAFSHVAHIYDVESLHTLASALAHAEGSGMSLGQVLRAQAGQRTAERFARAEKLAMQAPVKMLGPLIFCIFPCTFIVIGVPIAVRLKEALGA